MIRRATFGTNWGDRLWSHLMAHGNNSRAEELRFMAKFLSVPQSLVDAFETEPNGGSVELEGIHFVWGKVADLMPALKATPIFSHVAKFLELNPKHIYHLDYLSPSQEKLITSQFGVRPETLSFQSNKADVLLIDDHNQVVYVSIKDESGLTKLGQVANKEYGSTRLTGGFVGVDIDSFNCPDEISFADTWLNESQWEKIRGLKQRKSAYIKKQYPSEWNALVEKSLKAAYQCLTEFALKIKEDRNCICQFILLTLVGEAVGEDNFYIVFGGEIINVQKLLLNIRTLEFEVTSERFVPKGGKQKESLIIWLVFPERKYCLTKIEPAFDGGYDVKASQTKGIQYYFQHWPTNSVRKSLGYEDVYDFKQFLLDISQ